MKNLITIVFLLLSFSISFAFTSDQDEGAGILWRVSGNGLKSDSYILGTSHTVPISFLDSLKGFPEVWAQVTQVATETEAADIMDSVQHGHLKILEKFCAQKRKLVAYHLPNMKYKDLYTKSQLAFMDSILKFFVVSNMTVAEYSPLRLWHQYLSLRDFSNPHQLSVKDPMDFFKNAMDGMLERRCKSAGKHYFKLEEPFTFFNALNESVMLVDSCFNLNEQADILYQCALYEAKSKNRPHVNYLDIAYQEKNFAKYNDYFVKQTDYIDSLDLPTALKVRLFQYEKKKNEIGGERRTLNWMDKILTEIKSAPTLVAVGINHFIGENGLIHLLRQHGYTVEPVK